MIMRIKIFSLIILLACSFLSGNRLTGQFLSSQDYLTGDDGEIRMNINIIGHVKYPGTYLVYDGMDIMSALSVAGGYLPGADLKKIIIYGVDGSEATLDILNKADKRIELKPYDTIIVKETFISKILGF